MEHAVCQSSEFRLCEAPSTNTPYDPDVFAVDVTFTGPSGRTITLPAFWYEPFCRELRDGAESISPAGPGEWRVRFTPLESGAHSFRIKVTQRGQSEEIDGGTITVSEKPASAKGFVRVEPTAKRFFQYDDGTPLPLIGKNICWPIKQGTYDYDRWFDACARAGMNYTRLWMWRPYFGLESRAEERQNYNQKSAWQLDYVLSLAQKKGIVVMLCLDYHGIFQVEPDMWGGNNDWPQHPYNAAQGGPCADQNAFFTDGAACSLYRKRLRYLIGRYSAYTSLMSWQFFNEINNVFRYLKPEDVARWHQEMGAWLRNADPYRHLITTSFSGGYESRSTWSGDGLDYGQYHYYLRMGERYRAPGPLIASTVEKFHAQYGKPVYIGEYGINSRGFMKEDDPYFRGLRQGLWCGLLSGSAGTAMSWWWDYIETENLYPLWTSAAHFIEGTGFGGAKWAPAQVVADPAEVEIWAMSDGAQVVAYLVDLNYQFPQGCKDEALEHAGVTLSFEGIKSGNYTVVFGDPLTGNRIGEVQVTSKDETLNVKTIPFTVDLAVRVTPAE